MQVGYLLLVGHKRFLLFFYPIPILHYINNFCVTKGPVWLNELGSWIIYTTHTSLSPIRRGFAPGFVNYKKRCTRLAAASDKVYQLLAHGRWFSPQALEFRTPLFPSFGPSRDYGMDLCLEVYL